MKITKKEFLDEINNNEKKHNIAFIGMSSSGKSYWANLLSKKYNLEHIEIDKLIGNSKEFANLINDLEGKDEVEKLGKFFGSPWDSKYKSKEEKYLEIEENIVSKEFPLGSILDLTGSSIYHSEQMEAISKKSLIIYLKINEEAKKKLFNIFLENPKPICWNGVFKKENGESNEEALSRCYVNLLNHREKLYEKYADVTIPFEIYEQTKNPEKFVEEISKRLD